MNRPARLWIICAITFSIMGLATWQSTTDAQEETEATVAALQTEAADLKTMVALQTEVAELSTQVSAATMVPTNEDGQEAEESLLYQANADGGFEDWTLSRGWRVFDGILVNDGSGMGEWIFAPVSLDEVTNYAVEAEIQMSGTGYCVPRGYGLVARADSDGGINGWVLPGCGGGELIISAAGDGRGGAFSNDDTSFAPKDDWHTYRLEVEGNSIRLFVDDGLFLEANDNRYLSGGSAGLWTEAIQVSVRSFSVTAL